MKTRPVRVHISGRLIAHTSSTPVKCVFFHHCATALFYFFFFAGSEGKNNNSTDGGDPGDEGLKPHRSQDLCRRCGDGTRIYKHNMYYIYCTYIIFYRIANGKNANRADVRVLLRLKALDWGFRVRAGSCVSVEIRFWTGTTMAL